MGLRLHKHFGHIVYYVKIICVCNFINDLTPLWAMWNALTTIGDAFCLDRGADWQGWEKRVSPLGSSAWLWLNKSWVNCLVFYCKVATYIIRLNTTNISWEILFSLVIGISLSFVSRFQQFIYWIMQNRTWHWQQLCYRDLIWLGLTQVAPLKISNHHAILMTKRVANIFLLS